MVQLIRQAQTKIITRNGENLLSITVEPIVVEVIVNVNSTGSISVAEKTKKEEDDDPKLMVAPDFGKNVFGTSKIKFGKNVIE
jgi:hypothetical protein